MWQVFARILLAGLVGFPNAVHPLSFVGHDLELSD